LTARIALARDTLDERGNNEEEIFACAVTVLAALGDGLLCGREWLLDCEGAFACA